jgi:hypothetical protein
VLPLPGKAHLVGFADEKNDFVFNNNPHLLVFAITKDQASDEALLRIAGCGKCRKLFAHVDQFGGSGEQQLVYFLQG